MPKLIELCVPELDQADPVEIIELLVKPGDVINIDDPLITLETDKASVEVPSTHAGVVQQLHVSLGQRITSGSVIVTLDIDPSTLLPKREPDPEPAELTGKTETLSTDVVVIGSGPAGYSAAFRAAELGKKVIMVERRAETGGTCLYDGSIPAKTLQHAARVISDARAMQAHGLEFTGLKLNLEQLRNYKEGVVRRLGFGLAGLARRNQITTVHGQARFAASKQLDVHGQDGTLTQIRFKQAVIATGCRTTRLEEFPWDDPRVMTATHALELPEIPQRLLVVGGGVIGLEMACLYAALGSEVVLVEQATQLLPEADRDVIKVLTDRIGQRLRIFTGTRITQCEARNDGLWCEFSGDWAPSGTQRYDRVLVSAGRSPNTANLQLELAGVTSDAEGYIPVDAQCRTSAAHIYAAGDLTAHPMLAHKAAHEGRVAAEAIAGLASQRELDQLPNIAYTDPEIAWFGLTESRAKQDGIAYEKAVFPWSASGRSLGTGHDDGLTKILIDPQSRAILGAAVVGVNAGELLGEAVLGFELHAHKDKANSRPALSRTVANAAEIAHGAIADLYLPKGK